MEEKRNGESKEDKATNSNPSSEPMGLLHSSSLPNQFPLQQTGQYNTFLNPFMMPSTVGGLPYFNSLFFNNNMMGLLGLGNANLPFPNMFNTHMMDPVPFNALTTLNVQTNSHINNNNSNNNAVIVPSSDIKIDSLHPNLSSQDAASFLLNLSKSPVSNVISNNANLIQNMSGGDGLPNTSLPRVKGKRKRRIDEDDDDDFKIEASESEASSRRGRPTSSSPVKGNRKIYSCSQCDYSTWRSGNFRVHMRRHNGEKPFKCDFPGCNYSSSQHSNLKIHNRIHFDVKPFKCSYENCNFSSVQQSNLRAHEKRIHFNESPKTSASSSTGRSYKTSKSKNNNNNNNINLLNINDMLPTNNNNAGESLEGDGATVSDDGEIGDIAI